MGEFFQSLFLTLSRRLRIVKIYILNESIVKFVKLSPILGHCSLCLLLRQSESKLFLHILKIVVGLALEKLGGIPFFLGLILIDEAADVPGLPHVRLREVFKFFRLNYLGDRLRDYLL